MRLVSISLAAVAAALTAAPAPAQPTPNQPWSAEGRIEESDSRDENDIRYDEHRFRLEAGRRYRVSASSDDFDTLIRLYQAGETEPVAENDDSGDSLNSRITYTPEESAEYVLRILSFSADGRGAYTARAEALPPLPAPIAAAPGSSANLRWSIWEGELSAADADRDGAYFDDYPLTVSAGETRLILAESAAFDTMIWILRADEREGEPVEVDDDSGPGFNALLAFQPEDAGRYLVRVSSYGSEQTGAYRLRISEPLTPPPPPPLPMPDDDPHGPEEEPSHH